MKSVSRICLLLRHLLREQSGSSDLVKDSSQIFSSKNIPFKNNVL